MSFEYWAKEQAAKHPNVRKGPTRVLVNEVTYEFELSNGGTVQVFETAYDNPAATAQQFSDLCGRNEPAKYKIGKNGVERLV